jgi:DNA-binding SARP family transcriptional activator
MLRACLLGALEVESEGARIDSTVSRRPWAVFAYVALAPRPVSRSELAARFWPDVLDQSARASLRSALWSLRRELGESLQIDAERVGLAGDGQVWVDAREFERLAAGSPEQALALCRGELLEGLDDEWALAARERQRERELELLERLAEQREQEGNERGAIELTRRQVARDPLDEEAHRRLMARLAAAGDRAGAVRAYRALAERLRRELGVAPALRTRELAESLQAAPAAATQRSVPEAIPLVGREHELAVLAEAWSEVRAGDGGAVAIHGEAGIGKTRLAGELRAQAARDGALSAVGAALDLGAGAPLSLWVEIAGELVRVLGPPPADAPWAADLSLLGGELAAALAPQLAPGPAVAPDLQRTRLFEAVVALLAWAARAQPLLLVLEDTHDADAPSLELAAYVARRLSGLPVMLVLTRRRPPDNAACERLEQALRAHGLLRSELQLEGLGDEPIAALARSAGGGLGGQDVTRVVQRAEGNALLAVETARALAAGGGELAPSLRASVRATLGALDGGPRGVVELAAIAGRPLDPLELAADDEDDAAARALQSGLLADADGRVGFRHALLREAAYEEIAEPRRRALHRRWGRALLEREGGRGELAAEAARHLRLGGADAEAVAPLVRAAEQARGLAALDEAAGYLVQVLEIEPGEAQAWLELGEVEAWRGGRGEQAEAAFERGLALLDGAEPLVQARAWLRRARAHNGPICTPRVVLESAARALELIGDEPAEEELSEALAGCAWAEAVAGDVAVAEQLLARLGGRGAVEDLRVYDVGHARALALMRRGRFVDSYGPSIAAGDAIARAGRPDLAYGCWANAAGAAAAAGEHERALEFLERGLGAVAGKGLRSPEIQLHGARSFVLARAGRMAEAREAAETEQALAEQLGQPELIAMASHDRGMVALGEGEYELAARLLAESLVERAPVSRPLARLARAEALARAGDAVGAEGEIRAMVLEPVRSGDFPEALVARLARVEALVALALGERALAVRRLEQAIAGWRRLLQGTGMADSMTAALADLGRPVVGLVEPERELACALSEREEVMAGAGVP